MHIGHLILHILLNMVVIGEESDAGSGRIAVSETFAEFIASNYADNRFGFDNSLNSNSISTPVNTATYLDYLEFKRPDWIAEGIMYDMIDTGEPTSTGVIDNVDAYTIKECYNAMDADVLSLYDFCVRILGETNSKQWQAVVDLYDSYGI